MSFSVRPPPLLSPAPCSPSERRDRSPQSPSATLGHIPFFERDPSLLHPTASHRPAPVAPLPLAQPIEMATTGIWVVKRGGTLIEIGGRDHWCSREALAAAADKAGIPLSDLPIHTGALF